jgi:hypothetical protein
LRRNPQGLAAFAGCVLLVADADALLLGVHGLPAAVAAVLAAGLLLWPGRR